MKRQKKFKNKKAIFFSLDALIALIVILLSITVIYPIVKYSEKASPVPEDILKSLSVLKIGELGENNAYVQGLIVSEEITDKNKSVLEQIGAFYVSAETRPIATLEPPLAVEPKPIATLAVPLAVTSCPIATE